MQPYKGKQTDKKIDVLSNWQSADATAGRGQAAVTRFKLKCKFLGYMAMAATAETDKTLGSHGKRDRCR